MANIERTVLLTLDTIPRWLSNTPLAVSLREGKTDADDGSFEVPEAYFLTNNEVASTTTAEGMERVLRVLHYWGETENIPWVVLDIVRERLVEAVDWAGLRKKNVGYGRRNTIVKNIRQTLDVIGLFA